MLRRIKKTRKFVQNVQPVLKMGRSKFDLSYSYKTSMNVGDICPVYIQEIYPGDTFKDKSTFVCRTLSPYLRPVMDNLFMDVYFFFVPNRLVWSRWQELMGENVSGYWKQANTPEVPQVRLPMAANEGPAIAPNTVAAYFGLNIGQGLPAGSPDTPGTVSALPFRAFALIYNEWFRNENFEAPVYINLGDNSSVLPPDINNQAWGVNNFLGQVPKANKLPDYFTSCLPEPQKGDAVNIPIGNLPVIADYNADNRQYFNTSDGAKWNEYKLAFYNGSAQEWQFPLGANDIGLRANGFVSLDAGSPAFEAQYYATPANLVALGSEGIGNINDLRFAFQMQKMLEKDARGGTRYVEYLASHFGCISPDARLQRPEFLGGKRLPLAMTEVAQTSASEETSPLAQLAAYSATIDNCGYSKGFVEHGFVIGVAVIRQKHTYQQGIDKFWNRKGRYDFYDPVFANIGEQPVYRFEIYAEALTEAQKGTIFGYNEAWADLRYRRNVITGILNSTTQSGFDVWHYGDYYANAPILGNAFMKETNAYVDRTLTVKSETAPNFIVDFFHRNIGARVLPLYSIPGLADHH